jgi:iron complex transport system substrate-binding protein
LSGAFSFSSLLSIDYALDKLVPLIELAIDGDPNTVVPRTAKTSG